MPKSEAASKRRKLERVDRESASDKARLKALREAPRVGLADIEAGRFKTFTTPEALRQYLRKLADAAIQHRVGRSRKA